MRVVSERLAQQVKDGRPLPRVIVINGDEVVLVEEALDIARAALKSVGFDERITHHAAAGFDWGQINGAGSSMSLFAQQQLIEVRVAKSLGNPGTKALFEFIESGSEDLMLVVMPGIDKKQRQSKWYNRLVELGSWFVDIETVYPNQFAAWLRQRFQNKGLRLERGAIEQLVYLLDGNILAAAKEVDKLAVLAPEGGVSLELVEQSLADQASYDIYALVDAALAGDASKVCRVAGRLREAEFEPVVAVWGIAREVRQLIKLQQMQAEGTPMNQAFKQLRIWQSKQSLYSAALSRLTVQTTQILLSEVADLDQIIKGQRAPVNGNNWDNILRVCLRLAGSQWDRVSA